MSKIKKIKQNKMKFWNRPIGINDVLVFFGLVGVFCLFMIVVFWRGKECSRYTSWGHDISGCVCYGRKTMLNRGNAANDASYPFKCHGVAVPISLDRSLDGSVKYGLGGFE